MKITPNDKGKLVSWVSCATIWYGKILLISGEHVEVEILNRTGLRQWIKTQDILNIYDNEYFTKGDRK